MIIKKYRYTKSRLSRSNGRRENYKRNSVYESNNNKQRPKGSPSKIVDKYLTLAKDAISLGDNIKAEYYYQHADHFSRIVSENNLIHPNKEENKENGLLNNKSNISEVSVKNSEIDVNNPEENNDSEKSIDSVSFLSNPSQKDS